MSDPHSGRLFERAAEMAVAQTNQGGQVVARNPFRETFLNATNRFPNRGGRDSVYVRQRKRLHLLRTEQFIALE